MAVQMMQDTLTETKAIQLKWAVVKDNRSSDYIYVLMSQHVYKGNFLKAGNVLSEYSVWKVVAIIVKYLSYPNFINTCNRHIGT